MSMDVDGAETLAAELTSAGLRGGFTAARVVESHAREVQNLARRLAPKHRLPHYPATITTSVKITRTGVEAEIGPETVGQGNLGHILERGTSITPPHAHLGPALDQVAPGFVRALANDIDPLRGR